jgi:hypothetical protein
MKPFSIICIVFTLCFTAIQCKKHNPLPFEGEEGESGMLQLREQFLNLQHRRAPGVDWKNANNKIMVDAYQSGVYAQRPLVPSGSFANGKIKAAWIERGSNNQAGSVIALDYDAASNQIYTISAGGTLWRRSLDVNNWTELNRDLRFNSNEIKVIPNGTGGRRILTVIGKKIWYSDNEGSTFTEASGWNYYDDWGGPSQLIATNDGTTIEVYYSVFTWDAASWSPRIQLYYSSDRGQTFSLINTFTHGNTDRATMWHPLGTGDCYLLNQSSKLYKIDGPNLNLFASNNSLPANVGCILRGYRAANGTLTFFALTDNKNVYRSTNNGTSWQLRGALPTNPWSVGMQVSLSDPNKIFYGEVNAYKSYDAGASWNFVNEWWEYYGNVPGKLHADIMDIQFFRRSNNQEFALISNHGGLSVSYDFMQTTQNISLTGLNVSQYYDVRTDPTDPNYVYAGAQDQGYQRASTATALPLGALDFQQVVSGDYGHMVFSSNGRHFWKQYPGGDISYHQDPKTSNEWWDSEWTLPGNDLPNVGWMVPTAEYDFVPSVNKILVGGGNLNGGSGSHLIELTAQETAPYNISASQDPYDFKPNSNSGGALISAIAVSPLNGRYYVATDDGTFFRKNAGGNWQKATGFDGPDGFYLYGSDILASKIDPNLVWFCGSGYSNPPVWKSSDGGLTFTAISNGLPGTLVQEIAASPDEKFLYAATDDGPYVFDVEGNTWYSMRDEHMPLQTVYSVEYVPARNLVRFGTHGRGVWDFAIDNLQTSGISYNSTCGPGSGEIKLSASGGLAPLSYNWSNGASGLHPTGLSAGTYTVTVSDANGITHTQAFTINGVGKPAKPHDIVLPATSCGSVPVQWKGPDGGSYQIRYKQGNAPLWTVVGNVGNVKSYTLNFDADNGLDYSVAVRYVCPGNQQSAWVQQDGILQDCDAQSDKVVERTNVVEQGNLVWSLYPNPAIDWVSIAFETPVQEIGSLRVYNARGTLVRQEQNIPIENGASYRFSLHGLAPGVYFVAVDQNRVQKLIIAR